jgi:signal transduction histidine kinase
MIVDDEEGPRQSLRIIFKDDYQIVMADSGERAVEIVASQPIDAAVMDIRMSGMSGTETLEKLKSIQPTIEVIMLTAYETIETARQALRSGACDYLNKPFDISTMRAAVRKAMERRQVSRTSEVNSESLKQLQAELDSRRVQEEIQRTRGEIYASVIHDINGPLSIISGFLDLLNLRFAKAQKVEGEDMEFLRDRLGRMTKQIDNCVQISKRYLSFLREKSAEQPPVGVNQILMDLTELLKSNPEAQKNQLILHLLGKDAVALINGTDLMQVLLNLIVNALQCTNTPHRVELRCRRVTAPLDLATMVDGPESRLTNREGFKNTVPMLAFSITDDGPGIPPQVTSKIFDTQITTKAADKGTGLGLSIVNRLVRNAGGAVHLQTKVGLGTTFTVYLPARAEEFETSITVR